MLRRLLLNLLGALFTMVGLIGLVLPVIPGILFLALAAACFTWAQRPRAAHGAIGTARLSAGTGLTRFERLRLYALRRARAVTVWLARLAGEAPTGAVRERKL